MRDVHRELDLPRIGDGIRHPRQIRMDTLLRHPAWHIDSLDLTSVTQSGFEARPALFRRLRRTESHHATGGA